MFESVFFCLAGLAGFARLCPGDQYEVRVDWVKP